MKKATEILTSSGSWLTSMLCFCLLQTTVSAQLSDYPVDIPSIGNISLKGTNFENTTDNEAYAHLFLKFDSLLLRGNRNINIVHLGGSHIQADIYTHRIRQHLQSFYPGINGARGFIFPYTLAGTNNPSNYKVKYTGQWDPCFSTKGTKSSKLGLSGITVTLRDTFSRIELRSDYDSTTRYDFNSVRIFCNHLSGEIIKVVPEDLVVNAEIDTTLGYIRFNLAEYTDTLCLEIHSTGLESAFELYGLSLENGDPGVTYHSIGVNGATLSSYLKCDLMIPHLKALQPDWIIISIGTNDGYTRKLDEDSFRSNYSLLLDMITREIPDAAILLTVPNDSYLYRRNANPNTGIMEKIIFDLANSYSCGVWDFYEIMGGFNSSAAWFAAGLMNTDRVHFSKAGYILKGDLFFTSFIESWSSFNALKYRTSGIENNTYRP